MGTHEYSVEYSGYHYSNPCGENYVFQAFRDGDWLYITGLGAAALRANANLEVHNPPDSSLTDVGVNYFDGLDLYDGSDWRCWSTGACNGGHPFIISGDGGVPPYQYDRLNSSTADYYSFKAWGRPGDADYDGTQDPQDPDDDNDSLGIGDPLRFRDSVEDFLGTRSLDACPDDNQDYGEYPPFDAWPPDFNQDRVVNILDVLLFKGKLQPEYEYDKRFDLNADLCVNILDVLIMKPYINASCP